MKIRVPNTNTPRALLVVDVQRGFVKGNPKTIERIEKLIQEVPYTLYIHGLFHTEKGSTWDKQLDWTFPKKNTKFKELPIIRKLLAEKNAVEIIKETKSIFKGKPQLLAILKKKKIKEVHIVGFDTHDCVLASAHEAFDLGFISYVIEECTGSSNGDSLKRHTVKLLRDAEMTNHSKLIKDYLEI